MMNHIGPVRFVLGVRMFCFFQNAQYVRESRLEECVFRPSENHTSPLHR